MAISQGNTECTLLVITPVFNGERFLEKTIQSVLNARIPNMTYVVVNDGSTDGTWRILEKYAEKLLIIDQSNGGESDAVNTGFRAINSKYVMVLSADDMLETRALSKLVSYMEAHHDIGVLYPDWQFIDQFDSKKGVEIGKNYSIESLVGEMNCLPGPGSLIRRSALGRPNLRDSSYRYVGDYECWLYLCGRAKFKRYPETLAFWRVHGDNASIIGRSLAMAKERVRVMKEFHEFWKEDPIMGPLTKRGLSKSYLLNTKLAYYDSKVPAFYYLIKSISLDPWAQRDPLTVLFAIFHPFILYLKKYRPFEQLFTRIIKK